MENEQRGRAFRASSTSSLGREVRCGCQFYQSDSLLPERCTLVGRPPSRSMMQSPSSHIRVHRPCEHEYEPIASPPPPPPPPVVSMVAPVVRITDTDVTPVADSDDSIDDRGRFNLRLALDGDIILPLDGKIEDNAMAGRELGETIDTSDEMESEQLQEKLEENFARISNLEQNAAEGGSVPYQVPVEEEIQNKQANPGLQEKLRNQAEKLTSRFKNFQRPSFTVPTRCKFSKKKPAPVSVPENQKTKKLNRMERFKMALPERPRFQFPSMSKLSLKKHPKLNIKRPKVHLPAAISSTLKRTPSSRVKQKQQSTKSSYGSHKNIFSHFSSCQKIFDWKAKNKDEYTTSSPKETRAHVIDSFTYPRAKNTLKDRGNQEFKENEFLDEDMCDQKVAIERTRPWRHASLEEPRLAFRIQSSESHEESENLPWEIEQKTFIYQEEIQFADYEEDSQEQPCQTEDNMETEKDDNYNGEEEYKLRVIRLKQIEDFRNNDNNKFEESTPSLEINQIEIRNMSYEENSPGPSNAEQQSSESSYGKPSHIIQETDSDNFSIHDDNSHDNMNVKMYIDRNLHKFHEDKYTNSLTDFNEPPVPPQRPYRTKSLRKRKEKFLKSFKDSPPMHTRNDQILHYSDLSLEHLSRRDSFSNSTHRIVYRAETISREQSPIDYLDDIVVLKPIRRKSKSSIHSQAESHIGSTKNSVDGTTTELFSPIVPCRRKRSRHQNINGVIDTENAINNSICNGHNNILQNSVHDELSSNKHFMYFPLDTEREKNFLQNVEGEMFQVPPIPPKRRSRSRTASFTTDKNHSLHDVESISEVYLADCDMAQADLHEQSPGYAVIDKREKSSHVPPPRQRRHKSATNPRPSTPKRTQRAYSTLSHVKNNIPKAENIINSSEDVTQYVNIDSDEEHKNFKSEFLNKVQSRPLPAPPRPPRLQKLSKSSEYYEPENVRDSGEAVASTQTDPLSDDEVIEEEVTQAKLVMSHSRHGSQILISTERIPTPTLRPTTPSLQISDQPLENDDLDHLEKPMSKSEENIPDKNDILRTALLSDEPIRINNLEVGDLRVDRLSVSQLEAFKIAASEIDAMVVSASELRREGSYKESEISQSLLEELLAIRNRLETVAQFQERPRSTTEDACTATNDEEINIPGDLQVSDEVLPSPLQHVESDAETGSGNVEIIKMKVNKVVEQMARSSAQIEILQDQILQVKSLKPESEIRPEMDLATSRETSVEKDALLCQKVRSSSITSTPPSGKDFKIPSHAKSLTPVTDTSEIRPTHRTTLEMLSHQTITPHIEGRECTIETSQIPVHFFSLASPIPPQAETEISLTETTRQMFRAIRIIGVRNLRHMVNYIALKVGREDASDKIREVELVLCALLLIVAGLLIISFGSPRNVTHHHHWDYFNPPQ
ncbi:uncharacterized protein LOC122507658 isoform X2 [Leptopilina heterotoma]|uniref:uncharacterized protein LOC122507658 isoform X2 n=1 Tax=Leptopilina heterotoma TaxID=63436 RepID=UPI001CAA04F6|nr:uncharacterized protein LOC122507658 isoform X2 [Leptopilina heterotoma]